MHKIYGLYFSFLEGKVKYAIFLVLGNWNVLVGFNHLKFHSSVFRYVPEFFFQFSLQVFLGNFFSDQIQVENIFKNLYKLLDSQL